MASFARRQAGKTPIKQGTDFTFDGDEPIEFEDEHTALHFFFPKDYAHAVADSVTGFANRLSIKRIFYSQGGKNYMLVGVPWNWLNSSPQGDLIIDPTTTVTNSDDVYLQDATNFGSNTSLIIGKSAGVNKTRTIIKFNIGSSVPSNATVLNAQMKLRYYGTSGTPWVDRWVQAHQLLRHWRESEADSLKRRVGSNWLTPRGKIGPGSDSTLVDANGQYESTTLFKDLEYPNWKSWDLSSLTQKWVNLTVNSYGVILWATNEDVNGMNLFFRSSEYTTDPTMQPKLEIIWSQLPRTVYFLKDHLGSIRASVQDTSTAPVVGYDDYDPWGYILAGRSLIASGWGSQAGIVKNKFTGKEWDDEFGLNWNYFGARYYDPLIGRFPSVDRFASKYPSQSPYNYAANNPIVLIDINGDSTYLIFYGAGYTRYTNRRQAHDVGEGFKKNAEALAETIRNSGGFDPERDAVVVVYTPSTEAFSDAVNKEYESGKIASLTVFSHGYPGGISLGGEVGNDTQLDNYDLREISENTLGALDKNNFGPGSSCTLNGCNIGRGGESSFAQTLANYLGITVKAFDNFSEFKSKNGDGRTPVFDGTMIRSVDRAIQKPNYSTFKPQKP